MRASPTSAGCSVVAIHSKESRARELLTLGCLAEALPHCEEDVAGTTVGRKVGVKIREKLTDKGIELGTC
jgi:hypothetical protein